MKTGVIKFNLKDRKRRYTGKDRDYDIPKLVQAINSPEIQERVELGDFTGFYGHFGRVKFGLDVKEGGILDGKIVNLEPCFRTISLKAYNDGTVEHEAEFFDNDPGRKAYNQIKQKAGGFSAVISGSKMNGYTFHGFDFVMEPNFSQNRPYQYLDDIKGYINHCHNSLFFLDDVGEKELFQEERLYLYDMIEQLQKDKNDLSGENKLLLDSIENLSEQNQSLLEDNAKLSVDLSEIKRKKDNPVFDSATLESEINKAKSFHNANLPDVTTEEQKVDPVINRARGFFFK